MNIPNLYQESFKIRSSEVNQKGKAKLQSVCGLLQEVAGNHALKLDFDISNLQKNNLTWVLYRLHIQMKHYPDWRDVITIKTWPSSGDTLRAFRDFQLTDENGNELGCALSYWLMLDVTSRRPVPMPQTILDMAPGDISHVIDVQGQRLPKLVKSQNSSTFNVRKSDLDINRHVNNVKYIEWIMETLPEDQTIHEMDIEFHAECNYGDSVISELSKLNNSKGYLHQIRRDLDDKVVARAQSLFTAG